VKKGSESIMATLAIPTASLTEERKAAFDELLIDICDSLQITPTQHQKAESRYKTIGNLITASPTFMGLNPEIYPQGSMKLRTTTKPVDGPHDLDFVCEFAVSHNLVNPLALLDEMFKVFKANATYANMVEKKNRCVRVVYRDEFYLDILPACRDHQNGGTCIQVPDIGARGWSASNPLEYAKWFERKANRRGIMAMDKMQPLPTLQSVEEKHVLQLVVQLLKRWRDLFYCDSNYPPISIVLTTLAAQYYKGESSISIALLNVLDAIVSELDFAHSQGHRLHIPNPVHPDEDFSERWKERIAAYWEFDRGIRRFASRWREVCIKAGNINKDFEDLFGEVTNTAINVRAKRVENLRETRALGIKRNGMIASVASSVSPMLRNTNHGSR
jgi:hypothetical protein